MSGRVPPRDLVVLTADGNIEFTLRGLLSRPSEIGVRTLALDYFRHPHHDPGCLLGSHEFLRGFLRSHHHAIVVFDREGCGREPLPREALEEQVEQRLEQNGWGDRAIAVVINPELEQWVWSVSHAVDRSLGWHGRKPPLRSWLRERGLLLEHEVKPTRPKEALLAALRYARKPPSSSIFKQLGESVPVRGCSDPAFLKLRKTLAMWFPSPPIDPRRRGSGAAE
ncbi:MAG: hypothetical protein MUF10_11195 [Thermoanaerobaculaceae bacterium]|jgi:hypothetical protein|nr:hypothetical protein [Thermoanaerobaculaceae bacterium]